METEHDVYTPIQEIKVMNYISYLYSLTHTHTPGVLAVVFLCSGNYRPAGPRSQDTVRASPQQQCKGGDTL